MSEPFEDIRYDVADHVATVTFARPDKLNAFRARTMRDFVAALDEIDADDDVRAVVVTGAGDAFCAGAEMSRADTFDAPERVEFTSSPVRPPASQVRKPVIAAVNGHAIGIGLTLAMQCDIRIMATGAKYAFVHVRRGVLPDAHSHWTVPRAIGFARTAELFLTGRLFTADEAVAIGLASRALAPADVLPAALELARDIAVHTAPLSVALSKWLLWSTSPLGADETDALETAMHLAVMGRVDAREGILSFVENREPRWRLSPTRDWPEWA